MMPKLPERRKRRRVRQARGRIRMRMAEEAPQRNSMFRNVLFVVYHKNAPAVFRLDHYPAKIALDHLFNPYLLI
jgi:hypothetical protein